MRGRIPQSYTLDVGAIVTTWQLSERQHSIMRELYFCLRLLHYRPFLYAIAYATSSIAVAYFFSLPSASHSPFWLFALLLILAAGTAWSWANLLESKQIRRELSRVKRLTACSPADIEICLSYLTRGKLGKAALALRAICESG